MLSAKFSVSSFRKVARFQLCAHVLSLLFKYLHRPIFTLWQPRARQLRASRFAFTVALFRQSFATLLISCVLAVSLARRFLQVLVSGFCALWFPASLRAFRSALFSCFGCRKVFVVWLLQILVSVTISTAISAAFQLRPNKALHPTAYSFARRSSSLRFRRRVSLSLACCARLGCV